MLSASFSPVDSGAGQRNTDLRLTNTSKSTCTLFGYGGMRLVGEGDHLIETHLEREPNPGPTLIRLAPSQSASATLRWTATPADDETAECGPAIVRAKVTPPDERDSIDAAWGAGHSDSFGPVCQHGRISGSAYHR